MSEEFIFKKLDKNVNAVDLSTPGGVIFKYSYSLFIIKSLYIPYFFIGIILKL